MHRHNRWTLVSLLITTLTLMPACDSNNTSDPVTPSGLAVSAGSSTVLLGQETELEAEFVNSSADAPACDWYVDEVLGGNSTVGTITQDNPATYTAPYSVPDGGDVEISAVWIEDETIDGSAALTINAPTVELTFADESLWAGEATQIEAAYAADRTEAPVFEWYVNGELGGSEVNGFISQDNPATYTSPTPAPEAGHVVIAAKWEHNELVTSEGSILVKTPEVLLTLPQSEIQVEESIQIDAVLQEADREDAQFEWYVNNVLGGNETLGTITQDTPATYIAPSDPPLGGAVAIKARWTVYPELYHDSANLQVLFTIKHINAETGVDEMPGGGFASPFRTLTFGLANSEAGDTLLVAPGVYGADLGEIFPQTIMHQRTVRGVDRDNCIIDVDPAESALFYINTNSVLEHFTIRNLEYETSSVNRCISIQGPATLRDIKFNEPFNHSAIRVENQNVVGIVEDCILDNTLLPGDERGMELISPAQAIVRNCYFSGWGRGIMTTGSDEVTQVIEGCDFVNNYRGVMIYGTESRTDLGGGSEGGLGGNTFTNNDIGVYSQTVHDVYALYNTWGEIPPVECEFEIDAPCDFYENNTGEIIWE